MVYFSSACTCSIQNSENLQTATYAWQRLKWLCIHTVLQSAFSFVIFTSVSHLSFVMSHFASSENILRFSAHRLARAIRRSRPTRRMWRTSSPTRYRRYTEGSRPCTTTLAIDGEGLGRRIRDVRREAGGSQEGGDQPRRGRRWAAGERVKR